MGKRKHTHERCVNCSMLIELCVCKEASECKSNLRLNTRVYLLIHYKELKKTTNTGRLANLCLPYSEIRTRGSIGEKCFLDDIIEHPNQSLLLYPSPEAEPLEEFVKKQSGPFNLIVPDGNWRQASKVAIREKALKDLPRVFLPEDQPSQYKLRFEHTALGLATFEAIARALGILESPQVQFEMEKVFEIMVSRTLKSRKGILNY